MEDEQQKRRNKPKIKILRKFWKEQKVKSITWRSSWKTGSDSSLHIQKPPLLHHIIILISLIQMKRFNAVSWLKFGQKIKWANEYRNRNLLYMYYSANAQSTHHSPTLDFPLFCGMCKIKYITIYIHKKN